MTATFSILLPHRRNAGNDAALRVALDTLTANTVSDFHLCIDAATDAPLYERVNALVYNAPTELCVYWSSDIFAAPNWDVAMLALADERTFVTGVVVEPGMIGVHPENLLMDFGRTPETFRRADFEAWCTSAPVPAGCGFPAPYLFPRTGWLAHGGLEVGLPGDHHGFTDADTYLFQRWQASGNAIRRARSYFYHCQRYSEPSEQQRQERHT